VKQDWSAGRQLAAPGARTAVPGDEGKEDGNDEGGCRDGIAAGTRGVNRRRRCMWAHLELLKVLVACHGSVV
jgi:hypothetical protein